MKAESPIQLACLPASAGDTCGPVVSVEGVATNDNAFIRYSGHTLGLVPEAATKDGAHNSCNCGYHIMDDGYYRCPPMHFNRFWSFFWKPENAAYLEFILLNIIQA